jgi:hypothetical protein
MEEMMVAAIQEVEIVVEVLQAEALLAEVVLLVVVEEAVVVYLQQQIHHQPTIPNPNHQKFKIMKNQMKQIPRFQKNKQRTSEHS